MHLRILRTLISALVLLAPGAAFAQGHIVVVRNLVGKTGRVVYDSMGSPLEVPFAPVPTFRALSAIYEDLKVTAEIRDSARLEIGNTAFFKRGDIGGKRLSAYLECGSGPMGVYADNYRIDLSLVTFVRPLTATTSAVRTVLLGTVVNVNDGSRLAKSCATTGELERRIHEMVLMRGGN